MIEPIITDTSKPTRNEVFRTMFWHEKTYGHETQRLENGWRCWGCDAKMDAPAPDAKENK